jgi:hypothetical protein
MKSKSWLLYLLGAWCGATLFMWLVATQNFAVAHSLLDDPSPEFSAATTALSQDNLRLALRHQASEVNRLFFNGWGWVQVPLAIVALGLAWRSGSGKLAVSLAALMLLIVLFLQLHVVPETIRLGRILDFLPREATPPEAAPFWRLHHTYTGLDMLKFLLGVASALVLMRKGGPR